MFSSDLPLVRTTFLPLPFIGFMMMPTLPPDGGKVSACCASGWCQVSNHKQFWVTGERSQIWGQECSCTASYLKQRRTTTCHTIPDSSFNLPARTWAQSEPHRPTQPLKRPLQTPPQLGSSRARHNFDRRWVASPVMYDETSACRFLTPAHEVHVRRVRSAWCAQRRPPCLSVGWYGQWRGILSS